MVKIEKKNIYLEGGVSHPLLKDARKLEKEAFELERKKNPYFGSKRLFESHSTSVAYDAASVAYEDLGIMDRAISNKKDAIRFAPAKDRARLEGELELLEKIKNNPSDSKRTGNLFTAEKYNPGTLYAFISMALFAASLFFISMSFTGHAIEVSTSQNFAFAGAGFFIVGLMFTFFYLRSKKSKI